LHGFPSWQILQQYLESGKECFLLHPSQCTINNYAFISLELKKTSAADTAALNNLQIKQPTKTQMGSHIQNVEINSLQFYL
jgi:hypothetical protein